MHKHDERGNFAQDICKMWLHTWCRDGRPIFHAEFLGDKFESVDFYVELTDVERAKYFFFIQVKSTEAGLTKRKPQRLKIDIKEKQLHSLTKIPIPTYIIGVDLSVPPGNELNPAYIICSNTITKHRIRSIATNHRFDRTNARDTLEQLWREVRMFWEHQSMTFTDSAFTDGELR